MSKIVIALACTLLLGTPTLHAQSDHAQSSKPLGIWRATLDGVPSAILTLADDSGEIDGTLVLNAVKQATRAIAFTEVHTLIHPELEDHTLTFQVRRPDTTLMTFNVAFTSTTEAKLHCLNCGANAPIADLSRDSR